MKIYNLIISSLIFFSATSSFCQETYSVIDITKGQRTPNKTLPFDRPITLKLTYDEFVKIEGIAVIEIKNGKAKDYYNQVYSNSENFTHVLDEFYTDTIIVKGKTIALESRESIYNLADRYKTNEVITPQDTIILHDKVLYAQFKVPYKIIKSGDKYDLLIFVAPLKPNKFYDIKILRKPYGTELQEYFSLYEKWFAKDTIGFFQQIRKINKLQSPFEHISTEIFTNPDHNLIGDALLDTASLIRFYNENNLAKQYSIIDTTKNETLKLKSTNKVLDIIKLTSLSIDENGFHTPNILVGESLGVTSTEFNFDTRAKYRITPDFGYVYYGFQGSFSSITPYLGFQFEVRYFDKNIPLKLVQNKKIWHRLSFNSGITLASLKKEGKREDLFSGKSLLLGAGFRLSNAIRLSGGTILFNREDPNPLIDNKKLGATPFVGLSIDLSLKQMLNDVSSLIPLKSN